VLRLLLVQSDLDSRFQRGLERNPCHPGPTSGNLTWSLPSGPDLLIGCLLHSRVYLLHYRGFRALQKVQERKNVRLHLHHFRIHRALPVGSLGSLVNRKAHSKQDDHLLPLTILSVNPATGVPGKGGL